MERNKKCSEAEEEEETLVVVLVQTNNKKREKSGGSLNHNFFLHTFYPHIRVLETFVLDSAPPQSGSTRMCTKRL